MAETSKNTPSGNDWNLKNTNKVRDIASVISAIAAVIAIFYKTPLDDSVVKAIVLIVLIITIIAAIITLIIKRKEKMPPDESIKDRDNKSPNPLEIVLCRIADYTDQCEKVDDYFSRYGEQGTKLPKSHGVFFIEGVHEDWLEVLADHLAIRQKPYNYDALNSRENVDNLLDETVEKLIGTPKGKDGFEYQLSLQMDTGGEPDATREAVKNWVNDVENGRRNRRKVIYVPLDDQMRCKELTTILMGAKKFIDNLSIDKGQTLIVLFGFKRTTSTCCRTIQRIRNEYRKKRCQKLAGQDISFLQTPSKLSIGDIDPWISRLDNLYPTSYRHKLKAVCKKKFLSHKDEEWYYEDFQELLEAALIETRTEMTV